MELQEYASQTSVSITLSISCAEFNIIRIFSVIQHATLLLSGLTNLNILGLFLSPCRLWHVSTVFFWHTQKIGSLNCATALENILRIY